MPIRIILIVAALLSCLPSAFSQKRNCTVSGIVIDASNGEIIRGASVYVKERGHVGVATDANGFYAITIPEGEYTLHCSFLGYDDVEETLSLSKNIKQDFALRESSEEIATVVVSTTSGEQNLSTPQAGVDRIDPAQIARVPVIFGERDLMKYIQLLPGVKAEGDGASGFQVRGGSTSQNLVLLDGAPVTNSGHLMGFFSAFNSDAVRDATLYKGLMPAQYGGRTSSVLDVKMKEGNNQRYSFNGSVGLISAKVNVEGPIAKDKASFFVAARRTYADALLAFSDEYKGTILYFYDINAKVNWKFSKRDRLFASLYFGEDKFGAKNIAKFNWSNFTTSARWFHQFAGKLVSNVSLLHSAYNSMGGEYIFDDLFRYKVRVGQTDFAADIDWYPSQAHDIKFGVKATQHRVTSGELNRNDGTSREKRDAWEMAVWINDQWDVSDRISITAGLRLSGFLVPGDNTYYDMDPEGVITGTHRPSGSVFKSYWDLEPRASASWRMTPTSSLKAAYSRSTQNLHTIKSGPMSSFMDRYFLTSNLVKPEKADQVSLGYFRNLKDNTYELSAEIYYKDMQNVLNYRDGVSFSSHMEIERLILAGEGRSYGLEIYARKTKGRLTGWISYTLSKTETRIDGINHGRWYKADNDRTHDLSVVAMYDLSPRWQLSATWVYNTGQALSLPSAKYEVNGHTVFHFDKRNGTRAPDYHRLDVSATYKLRTRNRYEHELSFGLYNAYCRYNPFLIFVKEDGTAKQVSMFGIVPSISYNFKF